MRERFAITAGDRHDRNGFLRPVLIDQYRHQHDRRAGADNARDGAGEQADNEDEEEAQFAVFRDLLMLTSWWQQAQVTSYKYHSEKEPVMPIKEAAIAATHNSR